MKNYIYILFFNLFILPFGQLSAQNYTANVQQFGIEKGLLHRDVMSVFEDENGFIWIGGFKGLQRYDGHEFKSWSKTDRTGLIHYIANITQDEEGWLWLWNNDVLRVVFLHPETEEILTFEERFGTDIPIKEKDLPKDPIGQKLRAFNTNSDRIVFGNSAKNKILTFSSADGLEYIDTEITTPFSIKYVDQKDNIWVKTDLNQVIKIDLDGKILDIHQLDEREVIQQISEWKNHIYFIKEIDHNRPLSPLQLVRLEPNGNQLVVKEITGSEPKILGETFWELDQEGWQIYHLNTAKRIATLSKGNYDKILFEIVTNSYVDSKGRIWIAGELGLNKIVIQPNRFKNYLSFEEHQKPFNNSVRGIWVNNDTIFTNLERTGTFRINKNDDTNWSIISDKTDVRPILKKGKNEIWIGMPKYIRQMTSTGILINDFYPKEKGFNGTWSFFEDANQRLWIGTGEYLVYKNAKEDFIRFYEPNEDPFKFTKRRGAIQNMIPAKNGQVWFCSWTGLYLFDLKTERILARYASDETGENYLPADIFYYIYEDKRGIKWIGTSEGLIRWDLNNEEGKKYQLFTRKEGLSNDVIYAIFEDNHNRLWMSSDYGIMSFDKSTFDVQTYLEKDGISHEEFNRKAQFQSADGTIYFGGLNGITSFHPDGFVQKGQDAVRMLITDFEILDGKTKKIINKVEELRRENTIVFHPNDRFFRLKFVLPTFEETTKILYAWKVEGVDSDWNYQKENTLQFGVLPYGTDTLRIKGQSGGGWSPHELAIQIQVLKPFYLQVWFIIMCILSLIFGIFWFVRRRTRLLKKTQKLLETEIKKATDQIESDKKTIEIQADELRQLDKMKSRFFANVSHELRTPLTLMLGPISSAIKSGQLDNRNFTLLKKAQQGGKDLLKLVGSILDLSKMESGKMELNEKPELLFKLTRQIASVFESHAQREDIQFEFKYDCESDLQLNLDKDKLKIILNNLLSNAIKFTPKKGKIFIHIEDLSNVIKITVADTGRGIHPADLPNIFNRFYQSAQPDAPTEGGTGIGLALSQEFVQLMKGKIWVESELGLGSSFFVEIPRREVLGMVDNEQLAVNSSQLAVGGKANLIFSKKENTNGQLSTILIVEDNHSLRDYLKTILSPHYEVLTAENGQIALEILNQKKNLSDTSKVSDNDNCQLVLSDIMMPVMDGYQLLEKIKNNKKHQHLPAIMLTARAEIQDKLKALRIGVDDYLLKPFVEEELLARIDNLLKNAEGRAQFMQENGLENELPTISDSDKIWLENVERYIQENISNELLSVPQLAHEFAMSESSLLRKLKRLTGLSPIKYLQEIRLNEARHLLENQTFPTVAQVADKVGYTNARNFSRSFKARFGKLPSDYINN